jgi:hypothetical protein
MKRVHMTGIARKCALAANLRIQMPSGSHMANSDLMQQRSGRRRPGTLAACPGFSGDYPTRSTAHLKIST